MEFGLCHFLIGCCGTLYCCRISFVVILEAALWSGCFELKHLVWEWTLEFIHWNEPGQGFFGQWNIWPTWREWSRLLCRRCLTEFGLLFPKTRGDVVLGCVVCAGLCTQPWERFSYCPISINWLRNDNVILWREPFAVLRWKDRGRDVSWVRWIGLINMQSDREGRRNTIGTASKFFWFNSHNIFL